MKNVNKRYMCKEETLLKDGNIDALRSRCVHFLPSHKKSLICGYESDININVIFLKSESGLKLQSEMNIRESENITQSGYETSHIDINLHQKKKGIYSNDLNCILEEEEFDEAILDQNRDDKKYNTSNSDIFYSLDSSEAGEVELGGQEQ